MSSLTGLKLVGLSAELSSPSETMQDTRGYLQVAPLLEEVGQVLDKKLSGTRWASRRGEP